MTRPATLLGGRVLYRQPEAGFRTGIEPVLLAASVPAQPGARVLEAGLGAGAGLLCLAARVPRIEGLGIERDPGLAALARENAAANGFGGLVVETGAIEDFRGGGDFDHAMSNPPWHDAASSRSPVAGRDAAKAAAPGLLRGWIAAMAGGLRRRGTLSLILSSARLAEGVAGLMAAECGEVAVLPLWPRAGEAARLVILRGVRLGRGGGSLLPGLVLHEGDGTYTAAAERVLRGGGGLL